MSPAAGGTQKAIAKRSDALAPGYHGEPVGPCQCVHSLYPTDVLDIKVVSDELDVERLLVLQ